MKISVVINTFNSESTLVRCLDSVKSFDEIIICDMYSSDQTLEIAKQYNCKIVMHEQTGIVEPARNFAIQAASSEWVFVVDSDEVIPSTLKEYLYKHINKSHPSSGLLIPCCNFFMGQFMHGAYPNYILRFMKKDQAFWPPIIHAKPVISGKVDKIPAKHSLSFIHLAEETISTRVQKIDIYTSKEVERRLDKKYSYCSLITNGFYRFFKMYILKRGFLDGKPGLIYALMNSFYKIVTIAKIWEKQRQADK